MNTSHIFKRNCALLAAAMAVVSVQTSHAQAIIDNGTVKLGVDLNGNFNIPGPASIGGVGTVGLRLITPAGEYEATAPGCLCEGWGAANSLVPAEKLFFNNASGVSGSDPSYNVSFASTASTAISVTKDLTGSILATHDYKPSAVTPFLYEVNVTLQNTSLAPQNLLYRRVMDFDVEPTAFAEFMTLQFPTLSGVLKHVTNNGFATSDPTVPDFGIGAFDVTVTDLGAADHGALFDFDFGIVAPGASITFKTFYGAAPTERDAIAALGAVGANAYALGESSTAFGPTLGTPATFIFGFGGLGIGTAPGLVPEPSTVIGGIALAGLAAGRVLRRKKA